MRRICWRVLAPSVSHTPHLCRFPIAGDYRKPTCSTVQSVLSNRFPKSEAFSIDLCSNIIQAAHLITWSHFRCKGRSETAANGGAESRHSDTM